MSTQTQTTYTLSSLPKVAFGTWSWGSGFRGGDNIFGNNLSAEQMHEVFKTALEQGFNLWDTAYAYGLGSSEQALRQAAQNYARHELILSTKFTPQLADNSTTPVAHSFATSAQNLATDYLDFYWIHNSYNFGKWTDEAIALLKAGKVKYVGVSNHNLEQIKQIDAALQAEGFRVSAVQNHFSLLFRNSDHTGILDYCKEQGIPFFAYMVLEQGALSGRYNVNNPLPADSLRGQTYNKALPQLETLTNRMAQIGEKYQLSTAQVAIAYAITKGTLPLIGATKPYHVTEAIAASKVQLTLQEVAELEALADATGVDTTGGWEAIEN
ncbi:aldo/keto reductase [Psittacicella hinzii]|uniref:Aldo/keto reductase n=1 Tax=Psittacicella hinzii TaxID=2028575 RepID=A0A3A1YKZ6_9GAMM|nr:aldo/keto reductase [Psittacicella hinzii]RIY37898.1 aldo/keto reductase [Psittacicella hinzii]